MNSVSLTFNQECWTTHSDHLFFCTNFFFKGCFVYFMFKSLLPACLISPHLPWHIQSLTSDHWQKLSINGRHKTGHGNEYFLVLKTWISTVIISCKSLKIIKLLKKNKTKKLITELSMSYKNKMALAPLGLSWEKKVAQDVYLSNFKETQ